MPRPRAHWIRLDYGIHDHPKIAALAETLDISRLTAVGHLTRLWLWCSVYRQDGRTEGLSDRMLAEASGWGGDPGAWRSALLVNGLLDKRGTRAHGVRGEHLHGWLERNGYQQREAARSGARTRSNHAGNPHVSVTNHAVTDSTDSTDNTVQKTTEKRAAVATPKPTPSPPVPERRDGFADHCFDTWQKTEGARPPWGKIDYVALAEARKRCESEEQARRAWSRYLEDRQEFYAGHPPRKFLSDISRFVGKVPARKLTLRERNEIATAGWGDGNDRS